LITQSFMVPYLTALVPLTFRQLVHLCFTDCNYLQLVPTMPPILACGMCE